MEVIMGVTMEVTMEDIMGVIMEDTTSIMLQTGKCFILILVTYTKTK